MAKAGLCTIALRDRTIEEAISIARYAGSDGIEVWSNPPHVHHPYDEGRLREIRDLARENGLEICCVGSYLKADPDEERRLSRSIEEEITIAKILGARLIRVWAGVKNFEESTEEERNSVIDRLRFYGDVARREGIHIVVERHCNTLLNGWRSVEEVFRRMDHENVSLNYQVPYPASYEEYRNNFVQDMRRYLPISRHAHLQNYHRDLRRRALLSEGILDYSILRDLIKQTGYQGYLMVEFCADMPEDLPLRERIRRDIEFVHSL